MVTVIGRRQYLVGSMGVAYGRHALVSSHHYRVEQRANHGRSVEQSFYRLRQGVRFRFVHLIRKLGGPGSYESWGRRWGGRRFLIFFAWRRAPSYHVVSFCPREIRLVACQLFP